MPAPAAPHRVLAVLPDLYALTTSEQFPLKALTAARRLLGGDKGVYTEIVRASGDFHALVDPAPAELAALSEARIAVMPQHPVMRETLAGGGRRLQTISDHWSLAQFERTGLYGEFFAPLGVSDQITVVFTPMMATRIAAVSVDRGRRGFDDPDRVALALLAPHLATAQANAQRFSRGLSTAPTAEGAAPADGYERLTDRQREILGLIAAGHTNAQIARRLDVSPDTVRKHVESILSRLGASNRTAAAILHVRAAAEVKGIPWTATVSAFTSLPQAG